MTFYVTLPWTVPDVGHKGDLVVVVEDHEGVRLYRSHYLPLTALAKIRAFIPESVVKDEGTTGAVLASMVPGSWAQIH